MTVPPLKTSCADADGRWVRVRIVVYLIVGAAIAALLLARHSADAEKADALREVHGATSDGQPLVLRVDAAGVLRSWDVTLGGTCGDGRADGVHWHPSDSGAPARVVRRGDVVEAVEVRRNHDPVAGDTRIRIAMNVRVTGGRAGGTFRYVKRRIGPGSRARVCSSRPIGFSLTLAG
jgi:hypothetical protein